MDWGQQIGPWTQQLVSQRDKQASSLFAKLSKAPPAHLDYHSVFAVIRKELMNLSPEPMVVSEVRLVESQLPLFFNHLLSLLLFNPSLQQGANTMDMARLCLSDIIREPRTRIDAATWGTMGVGLGAAIASAVARPDRLTVAIEGDSAFGFSGMKLEISLPLSPSLSLVFTHLTLIRHGAGDNRPIQPAYCRDCDEQQWNIWRRSQGRGTPICCRERAGQCGPV